MLLRLVTPPDTEPVTLAEAKGQARVDHSDEDDAITRRIVSWRQQTERATRRALITQTWELVLDGFPDGRSPIRIERPPVSAITSLTYVDRDGDEQTLAAADYTLVDYEPALVYPAPGGTWPATEKENPQAVTVEFTAGYGDDGEDVPEPLRDSILLGVATGQEHREDVVAGTIISRLNAIDGLWELYRWDPGVG